MPSLDRPAAHGPATIALHWIMALLFVAAFIAGQVMDELPRGGDKLSALGWHLVLGGAVFALAIPRLLRRRRIDTFHDSGHDTGPAWERGAAKAVHALLYVLMVALPVTGFLAGASLRGAIPLPWGGEFGPLFSSPLLHEAMGETHEFLVSALVIGVGLHVVGTLWHKYVRHDGVAGRMSPFARHRLG